MQNLYKKKFPKRTFHQGVVDLLRLSPEQFGQFQQLADQFQGKGYLHKNIPRPKNKILPKTWETLASVDSPSTLAALIHMERSAHNDHKSSFHEGGGLWEGASSLFNGLWNTVGLGPEFQSWFGSFDYDAQENKPTKLDNQYAHILQQSYKPVGERDDAVDNWVRDDALDSDKYSVWVDDDDHEVHVSIRGTKLNTEDLFADLHVIFNNTSGNVDELTEFLEQVVDKYGDYTLDGSAHSLGGSELLEYGVQNPDSKFARYNLFNPGHNPLWGLGNAQQAIENEKFNWYLNSGDVLSNTFASMVNDDTHVTWAKPSHSPLNNHSVSQWTGDEY